MPSIGTQTNEPGISVGVGAGSGAQGGLASSSGLSRSRGRPRGAPNEDEVEVVSPRTFRSGAVNASIALPPVPTPRRGQRRSNTVPELHFHIGSVQMNVPQDPGVVAREKKRQAEEAKEEAYKAELDKMPGIMGVLRRSFRAAKKWARPILIVPAYYLLDHLGLGLNLNNLFASIASVLKWSR